MVYQFIDHNKKTFGLRWLCRHLNISLNCYYNYKKEAMREYRKRLAHIFDIIKYVYYNNNRVTGYRAMRIFLKRYGYELSNPTVHKYMNTILGLRAIIMRRKPGYQRCHKHNIFDDFFKQNFTVDRKNKVWCTDFTYMRQPDGKFRYNCTIIDLHDRAVIASVNSSYMNTELAISTLQKALKQEHYPKGIILHSDQGCQFTSWEFSTFCKGNGVTQSMSKAGCPYDNAPMDEATMNYINYYNYVRPHSYNNYLTLMEARYR